MENCLLLVYGFFRNLNKFDVRHGQMSNNFKLCHIDTHIVGLNKVSTQTVRLSNLNAHILREAATSKKKKNILLAKLFLISHVNFVYLVEKLNLESFPVKMKHFVHLLIHNIIQKKKNFYLMWSNMFLEKAQLNTVMV